VALAQTVLSFDDERKVGHIRLVLRAVLLHEYEGAETDAYEDDHGELLDPTVDATGLAIEAGRDCDGRKKM